MLYLFLKIIKEKGEGGYWIYILLFLLVEVKMKTENMRNKWDFSLQLR